MDYLIKRLKKKKKGANKGSPTAKETRIVQKWRRISQTVPAALEESERKVERRSAGIYCRGSYLMGSDRG